MALFLEYLLFTLPFANLASQPQPLIRFPLYTICGKVKSAAARNCQPFIPDPRAILKGMDETQVKVIFLVTFLDEVCLVIKEVRCIPANPAFIMFIR